MDCRVKPGNDAVTQVVGYSTVSNTEHTGFLPQA
jgi:hypothetical protein